MDASRVFSMEPLAPGLHHLGAPASRAEKFRTRNSFKKKASEKIEKNLVINEYFSILINHLVKIDPFLNQAMSA